MILEQESNNLTVDFIFKVFVFVWITTNKSLFSSAQETWFYIYSLQNPSDSENAKDK